jgi:hypothetical protein
MDSLKKLELRLRRAIETDKRARKGHDKTWQKECRQKISTLRDLIADEIAYIEYHTSINVLGR